MKRTGIQRIHGHKKNEYPLLIYITSKKRQLKLKRVNGFVWIILTSTVFGD